MKTSILQREALAVLICPGCRRRHPVGLHYLRVLLAINELPGHEAFPVCVRCQARMTLEILPGTQLTAPVVD